MPCIVCLSPTTVAVLLAAIALAFAGCGGVSASSTGDDDGGAKQQQEAAGDDRTKGSGGDDCSGETTAQQQVDGMAVVRHCGPASVTVEVAGAKPYEFEGGSCLISDESFTLNVGSTVIDPSASPEQRDTVDYVGIVGGATPVAEDGTPPIERDGEYSEGVLVTVAANGRSYLLTERSITLAGDRSTGTFTGTSTDREQVSGSFSCG